ncbi:GGDEF domain-containing protein [Massilia aurea]|uniref:GGDEF domain-containing protein n=1 Tax=Massilia aurea TaxID=373040 RepID=UPI003461D23C
MPPVPSSASNTPPLSREALTLRRMRNYWIATAMLYVATMSLLAAQVKFGYTPGRPALVLGIVAASGTLGFYALIRFSIRLKIAPDVLAAMQSLFAIGCTMAGYAIAGPLRASLLSMLVVAIAFCTFAMHRRHALLLAGAALAGMAGTMWWLQASDPLGHPPAVEAMSFGYLAAALLSTALLASEMTKLRRRMKASKQDLLAAVETIRVLATVDELTSLANRRHMNELLGAEERRSAPATSCVALLDLDLFKQVNDQYGHAMGDAVLRGFAGAAHGALREHDTLARWGGEEFLLLLPNASPQAARQVLERIVTRVHALQIDGMPPERRISFSAGLTERRAGEPFTEAISRADKALYRAKAAGRDRIEVA